MMMDEMMRQMMGGFGPLAVLLNILITLGVLALVVWAVTRLLPSRPESTRGEAEQPDPAEEILRGRFARGEIDAGEYERSLTVLRGDPDGEDRAGSEEKGSEER